MPQAGFVQQEVLPAALLVAATDAPDGGGVTPQARGNGVDRLAGGDRQHDAGMLDLVEGQVTGSGNRLEYRQVRGSDVQGARFPARHGRPSGVAAGLYHPAYCRPPPISCITYGQRH